MDRLINRVASDVKKKDLSKAKKDLKTLLKADKKQEAKLDRLEKKEHKKK